MLIKRLKTLAISAFVAIEIFLTGPVLAAGTVPLALSVQVDSRGNIASGCLLYFYQAGTVATPQNAFADFGLTTALPNPLSCDQSGRLPIFWLADGLIHIRLTDSSGMVIVDTTMQVLGPSSGGGGGGGGTVDPTTILQTGDEKIRYGTGSISGFVRENGLTIGNATSGATERANADTQNLFVYLYNADPNLIVSGGRSGNALNDFNASKQLTLPDMRGRLAAGLADMGNSAASTLTSTYAGCDTTVTTLGAACGSQNHTLSLSELPTGITGTNSNSFNVNVTETGGFSVWNTGSAAVISAQGGGIAAGVASTGALGGSMTSAGTVANSVINFSSNNTGGGAHSIVPPILLKTFYIKL